MIFGHVRRRGLQPCFLAATRASGGERPLPTAGGGARRLLSSSGSVAAATEGAASAEGQRQSQLHRGAKVEGEERKIWPYIKAAKQQFFNVILATLSIVMAAKLVEGKGARIALKEEIDELERRQGVLLRALSDETWTEEVAKKVSATGGKEALNLEIEKVVARSMLDKESAELEAMKAAAIKAAKEAAQKPHMGTASPQSPKSAPSAGMM